MGPTGGAPRRSWLLSCVTWCPVSTALARSPCLSRGYRGGWPPTPRSSLDGQTSLVKPHGIAAAAEVGRLAVRALIEAAREAVRINQDTIAAGKVGAEAAVARLIGQLDDFDRAILSARVWALHPDSKRVVAERLGVNPVSVQRNQPRAQARFAELVADPAHQEVGAHATGGPPPGTVCSRRRGRRRTAPSRR